MNLYTPFLIYIGIIQLTHSLLQVCETAPKDVVFLLDTSGSVGALNFNLTLEATKAFVSMFKIGPRNTHVAIETFESYVHHQFALNEHQNLASLLTAIDKIPYQSGGTEISGALAYAANCSFKTGGRRFADKILILVTDGRSYYINNSIVQANNLRKQNVNIFSLGVGASVDMNELEAITKQKKHVLQVQDFNTLSNVIGKFRSTICQELNQVMAKIYNLPPTTTLRTKPPPPTTTTRTTKKTTVRKTTPTTTSTVKTTTTITTPTTTKRTSPTTTSSTSTTPTTLSPSTTTTTQQTTTASPLSTTTTPRKTKPAPKTTTKPSLPPPRTTTSPAPTTPISLTLITTTKITSSPPPRTTSTSKDQRMPSFYLKGAFRWIEYLEAGILTLVTFVVVGFLGCFCRFCFFFCKRREDDSEEERYQRRKPCKRPAGWPT